MKTSTKIAIFTSLALLTIIPIAKSSLAAEENSLLTSRHLLINSDMEVANFLLANELGIKTDDNEGRITGELSDDREYTLPDTSGEICLSTGNCEIGEGGGMTGTQNQLARFTGSGVGDSSITDLASDTSLIISEEGNLGVGVSPDHTLQVEGDFRSSEDVCTDLGGGICLSDLQEGDAEEIPETNIMDDIAVDGEGTPGRVPIWREEGLGDSVIIERDNNIGIGSTPREKLDVSGTIRILGFRFPVSPEEGYGLVSDERGVGSWKPVLHPEDSRADVAERFPCTDCPSKGELVSISDDLEVSKTDKSYDSNLIGVVSTDPALTLSSELDEDGSVAVALTGRVPIKVNSEGGSIIPGDPLTSSNEQGVAKKANSSGRVVGLALESFSESDEGKDSTIKVFVNPHYVQIEEVKEELKLSDQETGEDYCITIKNGEFIKEKCK